VLHESRFLIVIAADAVMKDGLEPISFSVVRKELCIDCVPAIPPEAAPVLSSRSGWVRSCPGKTTSAE
jgi:hypothetical protein